MLECAVKYSDEKFTNALISRARACVEALLSCSARISCFTQLTNLKCD